MQDRDRPHTVDVVLDSLYVAFGDRAFFHHFPQCHECGHIWPPENLILICAAVFCGVVDGETVYKEIQLINAV
jgi:hypothetical protein